MPSNSSAGIPAIRTFQFDSSSIGQLSSAVNLFRGDVNIPQTLFTLPGRHSGGGLDVDFTIFYQSNVYRQAILWNRDEPTGVLGLGWDLPLTYIDAATNGSPDPDTRSYVLYDNGRPNPLVRQPLQPFRRTLMPSRSDVNFHIDGPLQVEGRNHANIARRPLPKLALLP